MIHMQLLYISKIIHLGNSFPSTFAALFLRCIIFFLGFLTSVGKANTRPGVAGLVDFDETTYSYFLNINIGSPTNGRCEKLTQMLVHLENRYINAGN